MFEAWQGYITMEIGAGHLNNARSLYKRCYSKRLSGTGSEVYFAHLVAIFNMLFRHPPQSSLCYLLIYLILILVCIFCIAPKRRTSSYILKLDKANLN